MYTVKDLQDLWHDFNRSYFEGRLSVPLIEAADTASFRADGVEYNGLCGTLASTGQSHIVIHGDLLEKWPERRLDDLLLHEQVHQYCREIKRNADPEHDGHGETFLAECWRLTP